MVVGTIWRLAGSKYHLSNQKNIAAIPKLALAKPTPLAAAAALPCQAAAAEACVSEEKRIALKRSA